MSFGLDSPYPLTGSGPLTCHRLLSDLSVLVAGFKLLARHMQLLIPLAFCLHPVQTYHLR